MKVLLTADTVGGVWTYAIELARALTPHQIQIELATMGASASPAQAKEAAALPNVTLHESRFKLEWMESPWDDVRRAGDWLLHLERQTRPDIVHLNGTFSHGALPWRAPVLVAGHSCVFSWWHAVKGERPPQEWDRYYHAVREGLRAANAIVVPTEAMGDALRTHYDPLPAPIRRVANFRYGNLFRPCAKEPFVLAAGRLWDEAKNISALVTAAPRLDHPVCIAGDSCSPDGNVDAVPAASGVQWLGKLAPDALAGWLSRAAVYALPARYEPFGLSALEAALSGCALVLGDIPSLREVWQDTALFVPPEDQDALVAAIHRLLTVETERSRFASAAYCRALRYYTPQCAAREYIGIYHRLLSETHRLPCELPTAGDEVPTVANRNLLSLTDIGLESWQRALSARDCHGTSVPTP